MIAGFLAMTALLAAGGLLTILYTYRLQYVTTKLLAENVSSLKAAQELEVALFHMRGQTFNLILEDNPQWLSELEVRKREWQSWLDKAWTTARTEQEKEILQNISRLFENYEADLEIVLALTHEGKTKAAKARLLQTRREVFDKIYNQCEAFVNANENAMYEAEYKIRRTNQLVRSAMYGLAGGGLLLGVFLGVVISRSIVNPIYRLVLKVRGAAGDQLVERVNVVPGNAMEELDRHVHELIDRINTATADLEKNRRLLARAEKLAALGQVAAGVAHEIRNPLTAIKMLIYTIHEDLAGDDEKGTDLAVIIKEIDRIERFVRNFLQFARPPEPTRAPMDLNLAMRETLTLLRPRLRQMGIEIIENYQPQRDTLWADQDQIKQVVMNLVLNATEAMPKGGTLTVQTARYELRSGRNDNWLQIKIIDSGSGIPEKLLNNLFDPFVSGKKDGAGLGLSVAHQIVNLHGGWIEATNNKSGGATFMVNLPADEQPQTVDWRTAKDPAFIE